MKKRVDALKRSYDAIKRLGCKESYTSFAKKIGAVHKPAFTFPGFGSGIDIQKHLSKPEELHMRTPTLKKISLLWSRNKVRGAAKPSGSQRTGAYQQIRRYLSEA